MKALVKYAKGPGNMEIRDVPIPEAGPDEVLIHVMAAGICGTDLHIMKDGSYPINPPVVLGHEISGIIAAAGNRVKEWKTGDRVVSETYYYTCGSCRFCKTGNINLCEKKQSVGSAVDGGMAEYIKVPSRNLHRIPDGLSFEEACMTEPLTCCVQGVFRHAGLQPGEYAVLTGPGTIGLLTLQLIRLFGCKVIVLGTKKDKERLDMAMKLGAEKVLYVEDEDVRNKVRQYCGGLGADHAFECSGAASAVSLLLDLMRKGGHYTQIGIPGREVPIDMGKVVLREYTIEGTYATRPIWWDKSVELLKEGKVRLKPLISETVRLEDWEKAFEEALAGKGFKHILIPDTEKTQA